MGQYECAIETMAERMFTRRQALLLGEGAKSSDFRQQRS